MAHAFWKGTLSFGLVSIGVSLRPAQAADELSFTLLDRGDFSPIGFKRYNKRTGREVPWERVVRGYEYESDQYVVLTDEELRAANAEATQTIELLAFVDRAEIEPIYFDTPYFVEPDRRSSRSYALLRATLEKTGLVGVARVVLRTRQHIAALVVHGDAIMLVTMRYATDLGRPQTAESANGDARHPRKAAPKRRGGAAAPTAAELRMATRLVEEMRDSWKPQSFRDEYRRDVLALIQKKIKSGKTHEIVLEGSKREPVERAEIVDLMSVLKRSIERRNAKAAAPRADPARATREPAKRRRHA